MRITALLFISLIVVSLSYANEESQLTKRFTFDGEMIHPGCIRELITELNGDDIVSSIHITRTFLRGCQDSNKYHQEVSVDDNSISFTDDEGLKFGYSLIRELRDSKFLIKTIEFIDDSLGRSVEILILSLEEEPIYEFTSEGKWEKKLVKKLKK